MGFQGSFGFLGFLGLNPPLTFLFLQGLFFFFEELFSGLVHLAKRCRNVYCHVATLVISLYLYQVYTPWPYHCTVPVIEGVTIVYLAFLISRESDIFSCISSNKVTSCKLYLSSSLTSIGTI